MHNVVLLTPTDNTQQLITTTQNYNYDSQFFSWIVFVSSGFYWNHICTYWKQQIDIMFGSTDTAIIFELSLPPI